MGIKRLSNNATCVDQDVFKRRFTDIQNYGSQCMAYSALQEDVKEFRHAFFDGFIAYKTVWGVDYVLSDPITPEVNFLTATFLFLEKHPNAVFCQISRKYAMYLSYLKFRINAFGVENVVGLDVFKVSWKQRKCLKSYLSKLEKQHFYVFECAPDIQKIAAINDQWLNTKANGKELTFMARPFVGINDPDVRYFYLIKDKSVIGFCSFDPIYGNTHNTEITSYTLQHLRVYNDAPLGSQDYLILNALFQFQDERFSDISLGLAPLYKRKNDDFLQSDFAEIIFSFMYKTNAFYNYKTIGQHKDHYKASQIQTYVATPRAFSLKQLCGLLKVNQLI